MSSSGNSQQPSAPVPRPLLVSLVALLILIGAIIAIAVGSFTYAFRDTVFSSLKNVTATNNLPTVTLTLNDIANVALIIVGYGLLHLGIAFGLWTGQNWARRVSLLLSVVGLLLSLPALVVLPELVLVALFAGFVLYYFTRPSVKEFFKSNRKL